MQAIRLNTNKQAWFGVKANFKEIKGISNNFKEILF
jgi:hypothetical protein